MAASDEISSLRCLPISADQTIPLRHSVLWPNAPVSHVLLPEDASGWHYGAFIESRQDPVAVISLFVEAVPIDNALDGADGTDEQRRAIRFRKFGCDPAYQGRGIGTNLLLHVISVASFEFQGRLLWCDARQAMQGWYERRGLEAFGDIFWKGPVQYIRMKIDIDTV
ncbi:hypothetical protein B0H10DRAFT_2007043 [Mycena sp. CBHHK59/15]|nr:hypothetical protein B0H10DRAFT_2007043 [Mycena sp. CBHHK59/15]